MLSKYEEAQGLTEEMVRDYMLRTGWTDCGGLWQKARDSVAALSSEMPEALFNGLARVTGRTAQSILRDMNPRWRPWPSKEARAAHLGHWLAFDPRDENVVMGRFDGHWFKHIENFVIEKGDPILYWPCVLGNKIPWPEKDGVML